MMPSLWSNKINDLSWIKSKRIHKKINETKESLYHINNSKKHSSSYS